MWGSLSQTRVKPVISIILLAFVYGQVAEGTEEYDRVTQVIQIQVEAVRGNVSEAKREVEEAMLEYKKNKEQEVKASLSNDYNDLQMYEWYEKEGTGADKKCLSHQRNLQMIRAGYKDNVAQCFVRADDCVTKIEEQTATLNRLLDKYEATSDLTAPCDQLDNQEECLAQAIELAQRRTDMIMAVLARFEIFKKLKLYEVETNYKVCRSISEIYKECEKTEIQTLVKCMTGDEDEKTSSAVESSQKTANRVEDMK